MICLKCQHENREGAKFCSECGNKLELICQGCGNANSITSIFCDECGRRIDAVSEPVHKELSFDEKIDKIQRYLPEGLTDKILSQRDKIEGERKQVTVMFCDMEGFTPLVEKLGPEETYSIMDDVYEILIHTVHDFGGTVNEMTGDGIMALFGAPVALEDAPQRAIRSAISIHLEMTRYRDLKWRERIDRPSLKMRIGIHTGPVVVGALGNDLRVEFKAVGDTVNLASRMEGLAEPGTTYVTADTFKLTDGFFRFESLGEKEVKGRTEPVRVYCVLARSSLKTRFDISAERGLTPFMARERELELLLDGFERIKTCLGRAFSIVAEAGMGKSRLLYEFRKAVTNEDISFLEGKCLSYNRGRSYHPIIDILKANFDIKDGDIAVEVRRKVQTGLKLLDIDEDSTLPYLLELLSVKDSGVDQLPVGPETRIVRIVDSLKQVVIKRSEIHPLILAVEDLHWADERSKEVLKQIMESIPGARVLMIFTYRPEYIETWPGRSYHSQLTLNRLSERENRMIASHLLGTNTLKKELEELILEKTEGVPFFVEEFIRSLKDLKVIERKDNQYMLGRNASRIAVPSTIQDVIMARVDILPEGAKEVLQLGSVIEREFSFNLLKMEMGIPEQELLSHLSVLKDVELLFERGMHPGNTYIFKHALTRDVVYNSILDRKKNTLHAAIGNAIESLYKENIIEHYGVLADHFIAGEIYSKGAEYSRLAATRAERAGAILDAIEYTRKRVASLECLPPTKKVEKQIIDARTVLGRYFLRKLSYKEAKEAISPIMDKAVRSAYNKRLPEILTINGTYLMNIQEDATNAFESLEKAVKIAGDSKDNAALSLSSWRLGLTRALNCEFEEAIRYFKKTLDIMTTVNNPWEISAANSYLSIWGYGFLGRIYQADIASEAAVRLSEESGDVYSKSMAYTSRGLYHYNRGFFKAATEHFSQAIEFCEKIDYAIFNALTRLFISEVCYENGDYQNLMHHHAEALELLEKYGIYRSWTDFHKLGVAKAQVMMDEGDIDLKPLYGYVKNNKVKLFDGYKKRFMGEILFKIGGEYLPEAENWIKQAIATDKKDGIMCCLARDYTILASLLKQKADDSEAKLYLAKAIRIFKDCGADGWVEKTETNMSKI